MKKIQVKLRCWLDENGLDILVVLAGSFIISGLWYLGFIVKLF